MKKVYVLGSINLDLVMQMERMPKLGESVIGSGFFANQGGKGANQAVACSKLGCDCTFLGSVGKDENATKLLSSIHSYGVKTDAVQFSDFPSGTCIILFDLTKQDNLLVVDPGANMHVDPNFITSYLRDHASLGDLFVTQLETNLTAVEAGLSVAKELGLFTVLNPAPARTLPASILENVDLIVPNETEAFALTGVLPDSDENILEIFRQLSSLGAKELIITLGRNGSVHVRNQLITHYSATVATAVDTTSAGDTFIGAICAQLSKGISLEEAIPFASSCAAITVSRRGAAVSIPTEAEVQQLLFKNNM